MKLIGILGSTGSIGTQALDLIRNNDNFKVLYLSAYSNIDLLIEQIKEFKPKFVCIGDKNQIQKIKNIFKDDVNVLVGEEGLLDLSSINDIDLLLNALVGYS